MEYNKSLLESWIDAGEEDSEDDDSPYEEWRESWRQGIRCCLQLYRRIEYCKSLLQTHKDAFLYYILAELYDEIDFSLSKERLYKHLVRYYCIMAIRKDRNYAAAWALLSKAHWWLCLIDGIKNSRLDNDTDLMEETEMLFQEIDEVGKRSKPAHGDVRKHIDKAICYIQKAIKANPSAEHYRFWLQCFCRERNEVYR